MGEMGRLDKVEKQTKIASCRVYLFIYSNLFYKKTRTLSSLAVARHCWPRVTQALGSRVVGRWASCVLPHARVIMGRYRRFAWQKAW